MDDLEAALKATRDRRRLPPPSGRRALRERTGVSQAAVAAAVGTTAASISRWEAGVREPRGALLQRYLKALDRLAAEAAAS